MTQELIVKLVNAIEWSDFALIGKIDDASIRARNLNQQALALAAQHTPPADVSEDERAEYEKSIQDAFNETGKLRAAIVGYLGIKVDKVFPDDDVLIAALTRPKSEPKATDACDCVTWTPNDPFSAGNRNMAKTLKCKNCAPKFYNTKGKVQPEGHPKATTAEREAALQTLNDINQCTDAFRLYPAAFEKISAALTDYPPEGFVSVPIEPTDWMLQQTKWNAGDMRMLYKAMIAARPNKEQQ